MLKQHPFFVKQIIAAVDCLLIICAFSITYGLISFSKSLRPMFDYWVMLVGFTAFYLYFAWTRSLFSVLDFNWMKNLPHKIVVIFVTVGILGAAVFYMVPGMPESRILYSVFVVLSFGFISTEKLLLRNIFATARRNNRNTTPIILFGRGRMAAQVAREAEAHPEWGLRIIRKVDLSISVTAFEEMLRNCYVEEVFFCIPRNLTVSGFSIDSYLRICEEMGRPARIFLNITGAARFARWHYLEFLDRPTILFNTVELDPDQVLFKRLFDLVGGAIGLVALVLTYPAIALAIKLSSPGPVFFKQVRVGKNGKRFIIYKYRSMYCDAEQHRRRLERKNEMNGAVFKIKDDPRVTPVGRLLRKTSMDELPQFLNVVKGEMSLVGTRPPTPDEVNQYQKWHHRRISIRPGLTGLWQVSGRSKITNFDDIVKLDLQYIDTWNIFLDLKILFKTFPVVLRRADAF